MNLTRGSYYGHHLNFVVLILSFVMISSAATFAQFIPHQRYELKIKSSDNRFTIVPLHDKGLSLIRENNKFSERKKQWELILLDTDLNQTWTTKLFIKSDFNLTGYEVTPEFLFYLFRKEGKSSNKFLLIQLDYVDHSIKEFTIEHEFEFRLTHFSMVGPNPIFGGYVSMEPAVILFETASENLKVIPGFFLKDTELLDLKVNQNNTFNTLLVERNSIEQKHLVLKTFDQLGGLLLEDYMEIDNEINILKGITSNLKREELIILGTYSEGISTEALGLFSVLVDPFEDQPFQYHTLPSLDHFLDYMTPKRAAKIRNKTKKRKEIGKSPSYKINLNPIRIEETDEGFYLLSEVYDLSSNVNSNRYPYRNNAYSYYYYGYSPYSFNNSLSNQNQNFPYGYTGDSKSRSIKILETVLTLFNDQGSLVWDNSLKMNDVKRYTLDPTSDFLIKEDLIFLTYKNKNNLIVNTSSLDYEPEFHTLKIPLNSSSEVIRFESEQNSGVHFWFKDHLYVWGYQSIINKKGNTENSVRYVFYINKFEAE